MFHAFIIDDDPYAIHAISMMFPWQELNISQIDKIYTTDGLAERILLETPEVVFIDIEIGKVSGLDIIRSCKEQGSESLFVIISGHDNFSYAHTAVNLGAIYYMLKPIDISDVDIASKKLKTLLPCPETIVKISGSKEKNLWDKILEYIDKNYSKKLTVKDICSDLYISSTTFYNTFKRHADESFVEYLTRFRLEKAKQLLISTSMTIPDISNAVGIQDQYYFNKIFKKYTGLSPSEYRRQNGGGESL